MKERLQNFWELVKTTLRKWQRDDTAQVGAALAYFTTVSLAPLLLVVVAVAGFFLGEDTVRSEIVSQVSQVVGRDAAEYVGTFVSSISTASSNLLATLIALGTALVAATGVFVQLQNSLNRIWRVQPRPGSGIRNLLMTRLMSFLLIVLVGVLLLLMLVINAILPAILAVVNDLLPITGQFDLVRVLNLGLTFGLLILLFAMIFRLLPDAHIAWRDVWTGAVVTALLFTLGQFVLGIYFANSTVASVYGAAGSFVVVLIWVFYSAQILLLGAEFTAVHAARSGREIVPSNNAVRIVIETREAQPDEEDIMDPADRAE